MQKIKTALSSGNVLAPFAVFLALGGGALAATKVAKNSVTSKSVKDPAIQSSSRARWLRSICPTRHGCW
jgi:hypothetical protein